jgi:hypoxanthine-guanine phosphoribosyltransferase
MESYKYVTRDEMMDNMRELIMRIDELNARCNELQRRINKQQDDSSPATITISELER